MTAYRIAFAFTDTRGWYVVRCRCIGESHMDALPVHVETEHGRKRLLVLSHYPMVPDRSRRPYAVNFGRPRAMSAITCYLRQLPEEVKQQRAADYFERWGK